MPTLPSLVFLLVLSAGPVAAPVPLVAQRTAERIHLDGRLDEPAWATAPVFTHFVESFPTEGAAPSFRTEARILYDDEFLYVGVTCFDPEPSRIVRQLGRRDSTPASDLVDISLSSAGDGRTGYEFIVNAAGVLRDQLLFADVNSTDSWDAVWDGAASEHPDGWSVEVAIPFRILRFSSTSGWGIEIRRTVPRTHQVFDSALIPRNANPTNTGALVVSRLGPLVGLTGLKPRRNVELLPYAAARLTSRPLYSDPSKPHPTLLDPSVVMGLDFKTQLTRELTLTGAINPDFGQVEADQVLQNLGTSETFFPEKRPFFLEGLDVFQSVGSEYGSQQQLFYSRRIGLAAPILGAAKLTGTLGSNLDIGVLEALVMGVGNPSTGSLGYSNVDPARLAAAEATPDRRWQFHLAQPFRLGPNDALPLAPPVTTNYFAAVARERFAANSSVGAVFTATTPTGDRCRRGEFTSDADFAAADCHSRGSHVLALDLNVRNASGEWGGFGQLEASQQVGGDPAGRILRDGTLMRPGDLGFGGHLRAGKLGGEPFRFDVTYVYEDPKLDLNAMGFQPLSNYQWTDLNLHYVRPSGFGAFHNFSLDYNLDLNWSADGRFLPRGINTSLNSQLQLPSYDTLGVRAGLEIPQYDTREINRAGVAFERMTDIFLGLSVNTDPSRRLQAQGDIFGYWVPPRGPVPSFTGWGWDLTGIWRPQDRLETRIDASYGHKPLGPRYLDMLDDNTAVFGFQDPAFLSVTLRQQLVITPRLTFQLYAQLFSDTVRYFQGYTAPLAGVDRISLGRLTPYASYPSDPNSHFSMLNLNAVLRWEYRLGSTLYAVYARSQGELPPVSGIVSRSVAPSGLFQGPATQTFLVKWSYWWNV